MFNNNQNKPSFGKRLLGLKKKFFNKRKNTLASLRNNFDSALGKGIKTTTNIVPSRTLGKQARLGIVKNIKTKSGY